MQVFLLVLLARVYVCSHAEAVGVVLNLPILACRCTQPQISNSSDKRDDRHHTELFYGDIPSMRTHTDEARFPVSSTCLELRFEEARFANIRKVHCRRCKFGKFPSGTSGLMCGSTPEIPNPHLRHHTEECIPCSVLPWNL